MKIKLLLALAIVAILVTITTAGFLVRSYVLESDQLPGEERSTRERVLDDIAAVVGLDSAEGEPEGSARATVIDPRPVVEGRVDLFGSCAEGAEAEVHALERAADLEEVMLDLARMRGDREGEPGLILARVPVDADGSFTLALPKGSQRAHLLTVGRNAYDLESQPVSLEAGSARATLTPFCGGRVAGRVFLPDGEGGVPRPAVGATVRVTSLRKGISPGTSQLQRWTSTDEQGEFQLSALPLPGDFQVDVDMLDHACERLDALDLEAGETRELEFHLTPGESISGSVIDPAGDPVEGAEVLSYVEGTVGRRGFGKRTAETDGEGRFVLTSLAPTQTTVRASKDGYLESDTLRLELEPGTPRESLSLVLEPGAEVAGRVTWPDGSPVVDELVKLEFDLARQYARFGSLDASRGASGEARTDEQGSFRITGLGKGPFSVGVQADAPGADASSVTPASRWRARADAVAPGTSDLELELAAPLGVTGVVRDASGNGLREFSIRTVELMETEIGVLARDGRDDGFPVPPQPDAEQAGRALEGPEPGEFRLEGLGVGRWSFYASAEGFSDAGPIVLDLPRQASEPLEFTLEEAITISGLVLSPRGAPIAGARVGLDEGGPDWRVRASGAPNLPVAVSADDGSFELSGLAPGEMYLVATADGFARGTPTAFELEAGKRIDDVELTLREGAVLTGEVFGNSNRPVNGALVQLVSSPDFNVVLAHTDPQGRFEFEHLDPGTWQVIAMPARERLQSIASDEGSTASALLGEMKVAIVEVTDGGAEHVVLGAPPADPVLLKGRIFGRGEPVGDTVLTFNKEGSDVEALTRRATTNEQGEFSITVDGGGLYVISASRTLQGPMDESHVEFQVEVPEAEAHEVELEFPSGSVHGRLTDESGAPAAHARVTLTVRGPCSTRSLHSRHYTQSRTDSEGRYRLDFVPEGDYTIAAGGMTAGGLFERTARHGRVLHDIHLDVGQDLEVETLSLPGPATATVRVRGVGGRPAEGAAVFARNERGELLELVAMATTDAAGVCRYRGIAPGRYSFTARKGDLASQESELIEVGDGAPGEVELSLQEGTMLWIHLRDGQSKPIEGLVRVHDAEGRELQRMVSLHDVLRTSDGRPFERNEVLLGPLPPGKYRVSATNGELSDRRPVVLNGRTERKLTLRLQ